MSQTQGSGVSHRLTAAIDGLPKTNRDADPSPAEGVRVSAVEKELDAAFRRVLQIAISLDDAQQTLRKLQRRIHGDAPAEPSPAEHTCTAPSGAVPKLHDAIDTLHAVAARMQTVIDSL